MSTAANSKVMPTDVRPDTAVAEKFITLLAPDGWITFATLDDGAKSAGRPVRQELIRQFSCQAADEPRLKEVLTDLTKLNDQGAGIYITVNTTDGQGRKAANIESVRALFIDMDEPDPDRDLNAFGLAPALVVETSPGKHHAYWPHGGLMDTFPLDQFSPAQKKIAEAYGGDSVCVDLPRLLRVPGFVHRKGEPFQSRLLVANTLSYAADDLLDWVASLGKPAALAANSASWNRSPIQDGHQHGVADPRGGISIEALKLLTHAVRKSASENYIDWIQVGMALHHETGGSQDGLNLWDEWSQGATNYKGRHDLAHRWKGFGKGPRARLVTAGRLHQMVDHTDPGCQAAWRAAVQAADAGMFDDLTGTRLASQPDQSVHPLARYVDLDGEPRVPRWVIPGFIGHGLTVIAGAHGAGKTTALLPLAMTAADLCDWDSDLRPRHWRHVVYITEDTEQAKRIVAGMMTDGDLELKKEMVRERLHMAEACRLEPAVVAEVAKTYREQFTRNIDGVEVLPLVVIDTKAAVIEMEDENSNSEASKAVALLKQKFEGLPVWLVGHVAKSTMNRSNVEEMSLRGAGAFEGDGNQVLYLVKEGEERYLVRGKTRFEAKWQQLHVQARTAAATALDEFGNTEPITLRWAHIAPAAEDRKETRERAKAMAREVREHEQAVAKEADAKAMRQAVLDQVQDAWVAGMPLNRQALKGKVHGRATDIAACVEALVADMWLYEVQVPSAVRRNPKRSAFLVALTADEREKVRKGEALPQEKTTIPPTWRKPNVAVVTEGTTNTNTSTSTSANTGNETVVVTAPAGS